MAGSLSMLSCDAAGRHLCLADKQASHWGEPESVGTTAPDKRTKNSRANRALGPPRACPARQIGPAESATPVFVEPVDRALPGQISRGFVIPFRRRVAIKPCPAPG